LFGALDLDVTFFDTARAALKSSLQGLRKLGRTGRHIHQKST
jgi:hypothetical protein